MDNVGIVVDDLDAAVAFFTALGMELEGRMAIEGQWAARVVGLDDMRSEIAMMRIPDASGRVELTTYQTPRPIIPTPKVSPANTLGVHRVMFTVDDIEDTLNRLRPHGAELVGEVSQYEDSYLLCYLRGPSGIIVGLAQQLRSFDHTRRDHGSGGDHDVRLSYVPGPDAPRDGRGQRPRAELPRRLRQKFQSARRQRSDAPPQAGAS